MMFFHDQFCSQIFSAKICLTDFLRFNAQKIIQKTDNMNGLFRSRPEQTFYLDSKRFWPNHSDQKCKSFHAMSISSFAYYVYTFMSFALGKLVSLLILWIIKCLELGNSKLKLRSHFSNVQNCLFLIFYT